MIAALRRAVRRVAAISVAIVALFAALAVRATTLALRTMTRAWRVCDRRRGTAGRFGVRRRLNARRRWRGCGRAEQGLTHAFVLPGHGRTRFQPNLVDRGSHQNTSIGCPRHARLFDA